jgi:hypothetical protein
MDSVTTLDLKMTRFRLFGAAWMLLMLLGVPVLFAPILFAPILFAQEANEYAGCMNIERTDGLPSKPIELRASLTIKGNKISGTYRYVHVGKDLTLEGVVGKKKDGIAKISMNEFDDNGKRTGIFTGTIYLTGNMGGKWTKPNQTKKQSLKTPPYFYFARVVPNDFVPFWESFRAAILAKDIKKIQTLSMPVVHWEDRDVAAPNLDKGILNSLDSMQIADFRNAKAYDFARQYDGTDSLNVSFIPVGSQSIFHFRKKGDDYRLVKYELDYSYPAE